MDFVKELRQKDINTPCIMLTGKSIHDITPWEVLDSGSDDFIKKPYRVEELIARIKLAYRRSFSCKSNASNILTHNEISLDLNKKSVFVGNKKIILGKSLFLILTKFLKDPHKLITIECFIEYLWGENALFDKKSINILRVHICKLKKFLKDEYIKNIYGYGYIFEEKES